MKRRFNYVLLLIAAIMLFPVAVGAQSPDTPLPLDPSVRQGVLPNGLTYFIRHNEYPKGQADFYIAQKVGSILEEDNQRGLAHFLEHMCFNGTENFPGNSLISWLESIGVKFGQNLNAYTSVDETVYNISNVPIARESVQDSCLLILHDWADGLLLDPEEIDKERGVIHQEWRRSNVGQMRILENLLPVMYPGSKYGYRLPIGTMEVVDNFPPQALRDYYETWYRPDQQGIVVVGDIDVDRIENKIKELFSPIKMPANAPERTYFEVPDHQGTIYAIGHDPEQQYAIASLMFLSDPMPKQYRNTMMKYMQDYVEDMIGDMINQRLDDLSRNPECPFVSASVDFDNYLLAKTKDAFDISVVAKGNDINKALETAYREVYRAVKGGFTKGEYERARDQYLSNLETAYNNRNTRENDKYVREYVRYFIDNDAAPGIDTDYAIMKMLTPSITVDMINEMVGETITPDNRVLLVLLPDNAEGVYPTEQELATVIAGVEAEKVEAYVDNVKTEPLIESIRKAGKIESEKVNPVFGTTEWVLSNGAKVIIKKTNFKDDEILFSAFANGGTSVIPENQAANLVFLPYSSMSLGLGNYTNSDLEKYLKGKNARLSFDLDDYTRTLSGDATPKDLPYLMELIYMNFTAPTLDETEFEALKGAVAAALANAEVNPQYVFGVKMKEALYSSPREQELTSATVKAADREATVDIIKKMVANAADYTFVFVGNVDTETLKPLVEKYIASLPGDAKTATVGMPTFIQETMAKGGKGIDTFSMKMETPQTWVFISERGNLEYTPANRALASIAGQILSARLLESVREREGAVYSIGAQGAMYRIDPQNTVVVSAFPMTPDKRDLVLDIIEKEFESMANSVTPEELKKVQEFMVKNYREGLEKNSDWMGWIGGMTRNGVDTFTGYEEMINGITTADVANFMKQLNNQGNYRVVLLEPAE